MAGSQASEREREPAVGGHPPRGAKLAARLPQPHLGQGELRGRTVGSAPVHPALSPTQHTHISMYRASRILSSAHSVI